MKSLENEPYLARSACYFANGTAGGEMSVSPEESHDAGFYVNLAHVVSIEIATSPPQLVR